MVGVWSETRSYQQRHFATGGKYRLSIVAVSAVSFASQRGKGEVVDRASLEFLVRIKVLPRGIEIAVSHEFLHGHNVTPAFKETGRVGVPELVEGGARDLGSVSNHFQSPQEVCLPVARLCRKDPL